MISSATTNMARAVRERFRAYGEPAAADAGRGRQECGSRGPPDAAPMA
ncbi:hypothetical protein [Streptomyces sp. A1499]|nr:hypothetical protein [Streptomyces sp. A1499]